ncbi:MAG TPA: 2-dehydropantoate 2-reductase [Myxococcales bacterium]|nr:2-dehydropantoate 2-reductase [Myxococcales bacterium]
MKIAVMGTGALGGYFGGRLAEAGEDVAFIARGAQLAALRESGLSLQSPRGNLQLPQVRATDDAKSIGPVDVVLFTVKLWSTEEAGRALAPLIGRDTAVVSLQNGVESNDLLARLVGREHLMGAVCYIAAVLDRSGVVVHSGRMARVIFGELDGRKTARAEAFLAACARARSGFDAELSPDVERAIWEKFVFIVGLSGLTALTRRPIGPVRSDPDTRALLLDVLREAVAVGRAKGVKLDSDFADQRLAFIDTLPPDMTSSMERDLERGNRLEVKWLSGAVARLGRELGIETPANRAVYAALKLHADGRSATR